MSRSAARNLATGLALFIGAGPCAVTAQDAVETREQVLSAEDVLSDAAATYGPPTPEPTCDPQESDEIVVCAKQDDSSRYRVKSSSELDPTSKEALDDGLPRAPDVSGPGIFTGPATIGGLCLIPPCPAPPALIIDVTALPEAPPGSDADRIARGLAPLGKDEPREGSTGRPLTKPENAVEPLLPDALTTPQEFSSPAEAPLANQNLPAEPQPD